MFTPRHSIGQTSSSMQLWRRRIERVERKLSPTKRACQTLTGRNWRLTFQTLRRRWTSRNWLSLFGSTQLSTFACEVTRHMQSKLKKADLLFAKIEGELAIVLNADFLSKKTTKAAFPGAPLRWKGAITKPKMVAVSSDTVNPLQDRLLQQANTARKSERQGRISSSRKIRSCKLITHKTSQTLKTLRKKRFFIKVFFIPLEVFTPVIIQNKNRCLNWSNDWRFLLALQTNEKTHIRGILCCSLCFFVSLAYLWRKWEENLFRQLTWTLSTCVFISLLSFLSHRHLFRHYLTENRMHTKYSGFTVNKKNRCWFTCRKWRQSGWQSTTLCG